MRDDPSNEKPLENHHNVARYCGERVISELSGKPTTAAFKIRDGDDYLSVNWPECLHEYDFDVARIGIRRSLIRKRRTIGAKSRFAILNAGVAKDAIFQKLEYVPQITRKVEEFDASHAGIYVRREKAPIAAYELARQVRRADVHSGRGQEL